MSVTDDQVEIVPFDRGLRAPTLALIERVFPEQSLVERSALRLHQGPAAGLLPMIGILAPRFWVARRGDKVCGTVGLYSRWRDLAEARWLAWFCVVPEMRGQGLGPRLLAYVKDHCRAGGHKTLKLYTSTDPNEAAAQKLYDRAGFRITGTRQPLLWRLAGSSLEILYREANLAE
jgi:N-acetylglutamate synthase-like GNAT family acetyltransferase